MLKNSFFKTISFVLFIVLFNSCDKEFNVIGEDLIGNNSFDIKKEEFTAVAYNQKINPVQSNNLPINALGVYNNPSFGTTKASFVTQVALSTSTAPVIDESATIKSAVLTIPYFYDGSKTVLDATTGDSTYVLDSIYGPNLAKMKLSVYESGFFLRNLDPDDQLTKAQKYYNDQFLDIYNQIKPLEVAPYYLNDDADKSQNTEFFFNPIQNVVETTTDGVKTTTKSAPVMKLNLNAGFFQKKILDADPSNFASDVVFKDYFRGLFFDIETIGANPGNLALIDFTKGEITITYTETIATVVTEKTLVLKLTGNTVSLLDQSNTNPEYTNATKPAAESDKANGVYDLYLKGGEGSMSILKLFGEDNFGSDGVSGASNDIADQLDIMRANKYLVNQAELTFHLNTDAMGESYIPQRIFLYDFTNNKMLVDYDDDVTSSSANTKNNRFVFGGIVAKETEANGGGYYYKFRITNHIRSLVSDLEAENVDLGLVVTENINNPLFYYLRDVSGIPLVVPMASVMNPLGAVVFGNNIPLNDPNYKKRLKFEIYYTKTN